MIHLSDDNKVKILLAAYAKHSTELLSIEDSQQKLITMVLGAYAAGITAMLALAKESTLKDHVPNWFAIAVVIIVVLVAVYGFYMGRKRSSARTKVREALVNVETALSFYEVNAYLDGASLLPADFRTNFARPSFLDYAHWIIAAAGIALVVLVVALF